MHGRTSSFRIKYDKQTQTQTIDFFFFVKMLKLKAVLFSCADDKDAIISQENDKSNIADSLLWQSPIEKNKQKYAG